MKVAILNTTHPDYKVEELAEHRALYEGGRAWRALVERWVPQNSQEPVELWKERKDRATYHNHVGPIVGLIAAWLFSEAPTLDGAEGDFYTRFLKSCDGGGTPWSRFWKERFVDAAVGRHAFAWVNLPARAEGVEYGSRAEELKAGALDARLVPLAPELVIDWGEDEAGNLTWVMVADTVDERGSVEQGRVKVYRWTYIDRTQIRRWKWTSRKDKPSPGPDDEAEEQPAIKHNVGRIPVVRVCMPTELWLLNKLHDPAVAHLRARNDLSWALHRAAHALMVIKSKWEDKAPKLGSGYYLNVGPEDEVTYAEPGGASFAILAEDVKDLREEVYRVVQQMALSADSEATPAKLSGASKQMDWQALEVVLSAYAELMLDAMTEAAGIVAGLRGDDAAGIVAKGLGGWQQEDLQAFLDELTLALPMVPSPTFKRLAATRLAERILQGEVDEKTLEAIRKEIETAPEDPAPYVPPPRPTPPGKGPAPPR